MTPQAGNDANYPVTVQLVDNSDLVNPPAATLNVAPQGLLDRTAYLHRRLAEAVSTSWEPAVTTTSSCDNAAWSPKGGVWWACGGGNADLIKQTNDYGKSWTSVTPGASSLSCYDLAFDNSNNCVVGNNSSRSLYKFDGTTWTSAVNALTGTTISKPRVRWSATSSVWVVFHNDQTAVTGAMRITTSPDRTTWTDRTASWPASFTSVVTAVPHLGTGGGAIVAAWKSSSSATTIAVGRCLDSALTTTVSATLTVATITAIGDCSDPIYSTEDGTGAGLWMIAVYGTSGAGTNNVTEFYTSADGGQTWGLASTLSSSGLRVITVTNLGHLWTGLSLDGFIVYSLNAGVTWYAGGTHVATAGATNLGMWAGGGGLLEIDYGGSGPNSRVSSLRLFNQGAPALT